MAEKRQRPKSAEDGAKPKSQAKRTAKRKAAAEEPVARDRMVDAAMALASERGWRDLSLRDIAEASGLSLADAYRACPSKLAILEAFMRRIDAMVLAEEAIAVDDGVARDRLFDVVMRRFDALQPYKQALGAILLDLAGDPLGALASLPSFKRSMTWMLEAAELETDGLKGLLKEDFTPSHVRIRPRRWPRSTAICAGSKGSCAASIGVDRRASDSKRTNFCAVQKNPLTGRGVFPYISLIRFLCTAT